MRAALFGVIAAGLVLCGRLSGVLGDGAGLAVTALLLLLVPTSREFSRRVLLVGCMTFGWTQLLWWWPLRAGDVGVVTLVLSVLAGSIGAWVGAGARPSLRARALVPRLRAVDLLVPATAGLGMVLLSPWLQVKSSTQTLGLLLSGWDHSAHFSMVHMIRRFGVTVDALAPPDATGGAWQFATYPQGYHSMVATIIEVMLGPRTGPLDVELLAYTRAVAILLIAVVTVVVAGFCALPVLRGRASIAVPVTAFVAAVIYLGPGAGAIQGGFGNFTFACCLVVALVLVVVPLARVVSPVHLAAMGGALVGVAGGWVLLLVLAVPALVALLVPVTRARWRASPARIAVSLLLVVLVVVAVQRTVATVLRVQTVNPLVLTGDIARPNLGFVVFSVVATLGACLILVRRGRIIALALVPVSGAGTAAVLMVMQVEAAGSVTYYGLKFMTGLEIVLLPLSMIPVAYALTRWVPRRVRPRAVPGRVLAVTCLAVAATQVFGLAAPDLVIHTLSDRASRATLPPRSALSVIGLAPEAPGVVNHLAQIRSMIDPPPTADLVARLLRHGTLPPKTFYLDVPSDRRVDPVLAAQWVLALTDSWTADANTTASSIQLQDDSEPTVAAAARQILAARPDAFVAIRTQRRAALVRELGTPALGRRIIGL